MWWKELQQNKFWPCFILTIFTYSYFMNSYVPTSARITLKNPSPKPAEIMEDFSQNKKMVLKASKEKKTILFWNKYWHWTHFHMGAGNRGFVNCPHSNCYTTTRRSKLWNKDETIHAVIFHGVRLNLTQIEKLKRIRHKLPLINNGVEPLFILFMLVSRS